MTGVFVYRKLVRHERAGHGQDPAPRCASSVRRGYTYRRLGSLGRAESSVQPFPAAAIRDVPLAAGVCGAGDVPHHVLRGPSRASFHAVSVGAHQRGPRLQPFQDVRMRQRVPAP